MNKLLRLAVKCLRWNQRLCRGFKKKYYYLSLRYQAALSNVRLTIATTAYCDNPVFCCGSGHIIIEGEVGLGYYTATAKDQPIMLQPRSGGLIKIGEGTILVNGSEIVAYKRVEIGKRCRIGSRTIIIDSDFHGLGPSERDTPGVTLPVFIGDNVFIGTNVTILKGVNVGKDAVIGACAVVVHDVNAGDIVCGNPAQVVGSVYK